MIYTSNEKIIDWSTSNNKRAPIGEKSIIPTGGMNFFIKFKYGSVISEIKYVKELGRGLIQDMITLKKIRKENNLKKTETKVRIGEFIDKY